MSPQPVYKLPVAGATNYTFTKKVSLDLGGGGGGGSTSQLHQTYKLTTQSAGGASATKAAIH